jgi:uncharacterized membrane protein YgcG
VRKNISRSGLFRRVSALFLLLPLLIVPLMPVLTVSAETATTETATSEAATAETATEEYSQIVVRDDAGLLSNEEADRLMDAMEPVGSFCNAAFCTTDTNEYGDAQTYGEHALTDLFGGDSDSIVFLIDMDTRNIQLVTSGSVKKVVTSAYCLTITDNVYEYASDGDYEKCAEEAFAQVLDLYNGQYIAQPMRFICAFLLALFFSIVIVFFLIAHYTKEKKAAAADIKAGMFVSCAAAGAIANVVFKQYKVTHNSGGSGGGSGGGGGGGGGGSFGGGGHAF